MSHFFGMEHIYLGMTHISLTLRVMTSFDLCVLEMKWEITSIIPLVGRFW